MPPTLKAITGKPQAIDSIIVKGSVSDLLGNRRSVDR